VTRWNRRLLFGAIAVLIPVLAGCEAGQDAPTLAYHPASNGVSVTERCESGRWRQDRGTRRW
jgi:hypothetical protein